MKRNLGIDFLRIFAMLLVVTMHYLGHGGVIANLSENSSSDFIWIVYAICHTAVNIFILISGYCAYGKSIKVKRIVELWLQILFYTVLIWLFFAGVSSFEGTLQKYLENRNDIMMSFSPVLHRTYGFMTLYIVMSLFMPIIANAIKDEKSLKYLLVVLTFFLSVIPTILGDARSVNPSASGDIVWYMYLFLVGNYIRRKGGKKASYRLGGGWIFCILIVAFVAIRFHTTALYSYISFPIVIASICCFILFLNLSISNDKVGRMIGFWSGNTLGVYLIHDNFLMRQRIWALIQGYPGIIVIFGIFIVCTLIDKIRQCIFKLCQTGKLCDFMERKFLEYKERL